ncbi:oligosaccharide flippase family protein [Lysobacter korlensis]|uniref:Oligosaccharide flippase family protein n=1 Tax=Lysobacter korlensis TaxID=553636 RepID=A0ABV6RWP7_9GAMM
MILMVASSLLVPAAGILTAPILAQALGAEGRGAVAAALAPGLLAVSIATLGLPEALTFYLAKHPRVTRVAVAWSSAVAAVLGAVCLIAVFLALPFLSVGDADLADLIMLATALVIPALVVNMMRGAATGRQMWTAVALERVANAILRIAGLGVLFILGELTVLTAVLVSSIAPLVAGVVYWKLFTRPPRHEVDEPLAGPLAKLLLTFGSRVWIGAVASMVYARLSQIIMAPLSNLTELGLFVVAITIADVPLIVAFTIQGTLFGVNSKTTNAAQITATSRISLLVGAVGCLVIGVSLPAWIGPVFGAEFTDATVPTWLLLLAAVISLPGLMAAAGLGAWGRPGLRSLGLIVTLLVNVPLFVLLVPAWGAVGAGWAGIAGNVAMTLFNVLAASRVMTVPPSAFFALNSGDIRQVRHEVRRLVRRGRK